MSIIEEQRTLSGTSLKLVAEGLMREERKGVDKSVRKTNCHHADAFSRRDAMRHKEPGLNFS